MEIKPYNNVRIDEIEGDNYKFYLHEIESKIE